MRYVLDFDEVIFNTTALKEKMAALKIGEDERGLDVFDRITEADPSFSFESLVFPGARAFIEEYGEKCVIVSSAFSINPVNNTDEEKQLEFQIEKILRSGAGTYIPKESIRVVGSQKSEALTELQKEYGEELVFVDDREKYVREARKLGIKSVWMDRAQRGYIENKEGIPTMLAFPRVGSFEEFRAFISQWEKNET